MLQGLALIPAAGKSTRMGRPKLALPLGRRTVLQCVLDILQYVNFDHILVVVGPNMPELAELASSSGAQVHRLAHETPDMRATVEEGLDWISARWKPEEADDLLLLPADHPTLDIGALMVLFEAGNRFRDKSLFIPTHEGRRGHPTLMRWKHVPALRAFRKDAGLNQFFRTLADETQEVPVASPSVLWDLDTPEDYDNAVLHLQKMYPYLNEM